VFIAKVWTLTSRIGLFTWRRQVVRRTAIAAPVALSRALWPTVTPVAHWMDAVAGPRPAITVPPTSIGSPLVLVTFTFAVAVEVLVSVDLTIAVRIGAPRIGAEEVFASIVDAVVVGVRRTRVGAKF